jgi:hypothetical protein
MTEVDAALKGAFEEGIGDGGEMALRG